MKSTQDSISGTSAQVTAIIKRILVFVMIFLSGFGAAVMGSSSNHPDAVSVPPPLNGWVEVTISLAPLTFALGATLGCIFFARWFQPRRDS